MEKHGNHSVGRISDQCTSMRSAFAEGEFTPPLLPYVKMYTNAVAVFATPEAQPFPLPFGDEPDCKIFEYQ